MYALERWLVASSVLEQAVVEFLGASTALHEVATDCVRADSDAPYFGAIVNKVQSRLDLTELAESYIHQSRSALCGLLNRSVARSPIEKLNTDILTQIFSINVAMSPCLVHRTERDTLSDISLVCVKWRRIVVGTPALWSHIDLSLTRWNQLGGFDGPRLWLDRCGTTPLHIHVVDGFSSGHHSLVSSVRPYDNFISEVVSMLQLLAGTVRTLEISGAQLAMTASKLFHVSSASLWTSLRCLTLDSVASSDHKANQASSSPFKGLLELNLNLMWWDCTNTDMYMTLSNCPEIHTLRLCSVDFGPASLFPASSLVLRSLRLLEVDSSSIFMLSTLHAPLELDLRLGSWSHRNDRDLSTVRSFLTRSKVVALTLQTGGSFLDDDEIVLPKLSKHLPHLRTLCLSDQYGISTINCSPQNMISCDISSGLPNLVSLAFSNSSFGLSSVLELQSILGARQLVRLAFIGCYFVPQGADHTTVVDYSQWKLEIPEDIRSNLANMAEHLIILSEVPTKTFGGVDPFVQQMIQDS